MKRILTVAVAMGLLATILLPAGALAWNVGDSQTMVASYWYTDTTGPAVAGAPLTITETIVQTVTALNQTPLNQWGNPIPPSAKVTATIIPNYTILPPWPAGFAREAYTGPGGTVPDTAVITSAVSYLDMVDNRTWQMVSTQAIFGGFLVNTATVDMIYGPTYPAPGFTLTMCTKAVNPISPLAYTDTMVVYPTGTGVVTVPGCGDVPVVNMAMDWVATTNPNAPPVQPMVGALTFQAPLAGPSICNLTQVDKYHFVNTETQTVAGANPCPPIPEIATITLAGVGLLSLAGFVWFRRRQASAA